MLVLFLSTELLRIDKDVETDSKVALLQTLKKQYCHGGSMMMSVIKDQIQWYPYWVP